MINIIRVDMIVLAIRALKNIKTEQIFPVYFLVKVTPYKEQT